MLFYKETRHMKIALVGLVLSLNVKVSASSSQTCMVDGQTQQCDNGCCGESPYQTCCPISTTLLAIACAVTGLVVLTVIAAITVCCYKNYRDKEANRVRQLRETRDQALGRINVEPVKPPRYTPAPPEYSEEMPDMHFRPPTVSDFVNMNQRYRAGNTHMPRRGPVQNNGDQTMVSVTHTSGEIPDTNRSQVRASRRARDNRIRQAIPEAISCVSPPPPYREVPRGQTPGNRHRRFIRTPGVDETRQGVVISPSNISQDIHNSASETADSIETTIPNVPHSNDLDTNTAETHTESTRAESRVETITRVLQPSHLSARGNTLAREENIRLARNTPYPRQDNRNIRHTNNGGITGNLDDLVHI